MTYKMKLYCTLKKVRHTYIYDYNVENLVTFLLFLFICRYITNITCYQ